jgi:hypothetical protein
MPGDNRKGFEMLMILACFKTEMVFTQKFYTSN